MREDVHSSNKSSQATKTSFAQYLIESDFKYLVFIGKSMQYFGKRTLIVFSLGLFLGAVSVYGYALSKQSLPFLKPSPEIKKIVLRGEVKTTEGEPVEAFSIGILDSRHGPFESEYGSFEVRVPFKQTYSIVVWPPSGYYPVKLYGDQHVTKKEDGGYSLGAPLRAFPSNLGIVEGTAKDQNEVPIKGYVEVEGTMKKIIRIQPDGYFRLTDIPLGKAMVRVIEDVNGRELYKDSINVELSGPTSQDITVKMEN